MISKDSRYSSVVLSPGTIATFMASIPLAVAPLRFIAAFSKRTISASGSASNAAVAAIQPATPPPIIRISQDSALYLPPKKTHSLLLLDSNIFSGLITAWCFTLNPLQLNQSELTWLVILNHNLHGMFFLVSSGSISFTIGYVGMINLAKLTTHLTVMGMSNNAKYRTLI